MRKVEFYITNSKTLEDTLRRVDYYHSPVRATIDCDNWMSISKSYHCKVYKDEGVNSAGHLNWEQMQSDADECD